MDIVNGVLNGLQFNFTAFITVVVLFVVFHYAMRAIIYDRLLETRAARSGQIEGRLAQARQYADKAQLLKSEYEKGIRKIHEELHGQLQHAISQAEADAARQIAVGRTEADRILDAGLTQLEEELKRMEDDMEQRVSKLAGSIARRVVEQNFSADTQTKLLARMGG